MPCKTRQAALKPKPHYFLHLLPRRMFYQYLPADWRPMQVDVAERALSAFESRIDWSTWGRSR